MEDKYFGVDKSLEISLFEYGVIISKKTYEPGHKVFFKQSDGSYGISYVSENELDRYIDGKEFMSEEGIREFLDYLNIDTPDQWKELDIAHKLHSLLSYWGPESILGKDYFGYTEDFMHEQLLTNQL